MTGTEKFSFVLVHGTWATGAPWTQADSKLQRYLGSKFPDANIERIDWSGKNQFEARVEASRSIESCVLGLADVEPGTRVIMIGHSHGGSAINYAFRKSKKLRSMTAGIVYMSTPFMTFAQRPGYKQLYQALLTSVCLALLLVGLFAIGLTGYDGKHMAKSTATLFSFGAIYVLVLAALYRYLLGRHRDWLGEIEKLTPSVKEMDTMTPLQVPSRFYRSTGDEVALALGTLQLFSAVGSLLGRFIANLVDWVTGHTWRLWAGGPSKFFVVAMALAAIALAVCAGAIAKELGATFYATLDVFNPFSQTVSVATEGRFEEVVFPPAIFIARTGICLLAILCFFSVVTTVLYALTNLITWRVFGMWSLANAFYFECAAEPMPFGLNTFLHTSWNEEDPKMAQKIFSLHHSEPYSSIETLENLEEWVKSLA